MWLDTVRIVRDTGNVSLLLPPGVDSLADAPAQLTEAISHALRILKYVELPLDEAPERSIWMDVPKLREHFDRVDRERREKYGMPADDHNDPGFTPRGTKGVDWQENDIDLIARG